MTRARATEATLGTHRRLATDAMAIFATVVVARGVGLISQAWAARCLGPANLGISGVVQSFAQQAALLCGVGLDNVAARAIARDPDSAARVTAAVVRLRVIVAGIVSALWALGALAFAPPNVRFPWLLGSLIVFGGSLSLLFVFQAMERLPLFNVASMAGTLATSAVIFAFFRPGVGVGMDLLATVAGTTVTVVITWGVYRRLRTEWPAVSSAPVAMKPLLLQSLRYQAQVVLIFFYSQYQIPLIAWRLGTPEAGVFRLAFLMSTGLGLAFNSATGLLLPRLINWKLEGVEVFRRRQRGLAWRFLLIGLAAAALASLLAPLLFERLLGRDFADGMPVFRILVFGRVVVFVAQVYQYGLTALGRDNASLGVTLAGCVSSLVVNAAVIDRFGLIGVAWGSVIAETVIAVASWRACETALSRERILSAATTSPSGE